MAQLEAPHVSVLTKVDLMHESIKVSTRVSGIDVAPEPWLPVLC